MILVGGLAALLQAFVSLSATAKVLIAVSSAAALISLCFYAAGAQDPDENSPDSLSGWNLLAIVPFFDTRFDFLNAAFQHSGQSIFKFKLLQNTVIAVSGAEGRKDFLTSRGLDINEGFKLLSGAIPMLPGVTSDLQARRIATIHKRLSMAQTSEHLSRLLPKILDDGERLMGLWGNSGTIDIFDCIPRMFFQTSVRCLSATEIADDDDAVARLKQLYDTLDTATTPASVLFPWFPSPSMISKLVATVKIYKIVNGVVQKRTQSGVVEDDTLQILVDNADDKMVMIGFIMGLLVAGARSTGTTASWLTIFLAGHPEWRMKAREEAESLLLTHSCYSPGDSVKSALASIPLEIWENETPIFDSLIRETLRLAQPHTAMRRNMGPDAYIGGKRVPSGSYVVYPFSDVHLDSELYPDPWTFNPARPENKTPHSWIGWGGGTTVCMGQRLARLSLKLITALMLLELDFDLVDRRTGQPPLVLPQPNWNDALTCKPDNEDTRHMRYRRRQCMAKS
ncbi:cytochrome P450 [Cristinia sonorae]|uniref:Cytochrome P450 n=1 Tax=Cristinia sonorae TaxID=1940300 RepID=A0A8K0URN2_9AGAR|nr:cytochrome P450 [Cristinia sonorae]